MYLVVSIHFHVQFSTIFSLFSIDNFYFGIYAHLCSLHSEFLPCLLFLLYPQIPDYRALFS